MENDYPLRSLFLYLTDRCNLFCSHCWISPKVSKQRQDGIPFEALMRIVQDAKALGLQNVKLTGGEPFLYRHVKPLLSFLASEDLAITVETNGTLITKGLAKRLRESGVSQVAVSLDGASAEIHDAIRNEKGCFDRTVRGVRLLSDHGIHTQVILTLQQGNRSELPAVIDLCRRLKVGSLKINYLLPMGRGQGAFDCGKNLDLQTLTALHRLVTTRWGDLKEPDILFDLPVAFRTLDEIKRRGVCECSILHILGILSDGDYSICGIGQSEPELRMGNILTDAIGDIWHHSRILRELRTSLPGKLEGICRECIFKFQCLGACRANAYAVDRNLFASNFLCRQLYDSGGFPPSRQIRSGDVAGC